MNFKKIINSIVKSHNTNKIADKNSYCLMDEEGYLIDKIIIQKIQIKLNKYFEELMKLEIKEYGNELGGEYICCNEDGNWDQITFRNLTYYQHNENIKPSGNLDKETELKIFGNYEFYRKYKEVI